MTSLRQLQQAFAATLLAEKSGHQAYLFGANKIPIKRLVNVYRNNSQTSLRTALAAVYPVVQRLVGQEFFRHLANCYKRTYPPQSGDLQVFGRYLSDFLGKFDPVASLPYIADVAQLEWSYQVVSNRAPLDAFELATLEEHNSMQWSDLRFKLAPACRLVRSSYPIFSIWRVNQEGYRGDAAVDLDEGSQTVLVLRSTNDIELWRLQDPEAAFIRALTRGATLGATVEMLVSNGHEFNLETLLLNYVQSGCLVVATFEELNVAGAAT